MRVKGLVRAATLVRQQLEAGIRPEEARQFRQQVASVLRTVDSICARNGISPDLLPARSRQAYWYLHELDTEHLPLPPAPGALSATPSLHIKNVVKGGNYLADLLWQQSDVPAHSVTPGRPLIRELQRQADNIERICIERKVAPAALATPSRRVYCWLKFLLSEDNLTRHLATLAGARAVMGRIQSPRGRQFHIYLMNLDSLWRRNAYRDMLFLKVNQGFLGAGPETWEALLRTALFQRDQVSDRRVRDFGDSDEFNEVLFELEAFTSPAVITAQGQFHDLEESFHRVNAVYFQGRMARPNLVWSQVRTVQTFGHYQPSRDVVMLSLSLDQPGVPASLVDYLMYHELLHKKHGATVVDGRRLVHTPEFRKDEQGFTGYQSARRQLAELALRLRGNGQQRDARSRSGSSPRSSRRGPHQ